MSEHYLKLDIPGIAIRSWETGDKGSLAKYANNRKIWLNLKEDFPHPYTEKDAASWIAFMRKQSPQTAFAIANETRAIGGIGFSIHENVHRRSALIGYWLGEPFWGKGIATDALIKLSEYVFNNFDIARLYAGVFEWNPASVRVLEKAGYLFEGRLRKHVTKDDQTIDELIYALVREQS